ncbi:hypothetical protein ILYODFUR_023198 [Ilyodon furcidens]|uniref:Uncharacterized protein n=1 Tax=Ilyodon furcidens TaxID=33524 RepID=A0ABV0U9G4_9TELE
MGNREEKYISELSPQRCFNNLKQQFDGACLGSKIIVKSPEKGEKLFLKETKWFHSLKLCTLIFKQDPKLKQDKIEYSIADTIRGEAEMFFSNLVFRVSLNFYVANVCPFRLSI